MSDRVTAVFDTHGQAEYARNELMQAGERQLSWPVDDNYLGRFVT